MIAVAFTAVVGLVGQQGMSRLVAASDRIVDTDAKPALRLGEAVKAWKNAGQISTDDDRVVVRVVDCHAVSTLL